MTADSDTDLTLLQANYEHAKHIYEFMYKEMVKNGFSIKKLVLPEIINKSLASSTFIIETTAEVFKVDIRAKSRRRGIVKGRHAAIYMLSKYTQLSLMGIAKLFYFKDHTSVINSKKTCANWMNHDYEYRKRVEAVDNLIIAKLQSN